MRRAAVVSLVVLLGALVAPAPRAAVPVAPHLDEEVDCLEPAPRQVDLGATPLDGKRAIVDVLVLLDGVTQAQGAAAIKDAKRAYQPIGIDLRPRYAAVNVQSDGSTEGADGKQWQTASSTRAMTVAKNAVGGKAPAGVEVVYLLTAKELYTGDDQPDDESRSYALAGLADCIGGIAYRHRAFAIGERLTLGEQPEGISVADHLPGKILAHEVGHLLGAHHHYANCIENVPAAATRPATDVCTLLFNDVSVVSLHFSAVNRAIVRGHALAYRR
jgi:hypothetical protein